MKKLVCMMLALLMVAGLFVGCAGTDVTQAATEVATAVAETVAAAEPAAVAAGTEEITVAEVEVDKDAMTYSEAPVLAEKVAAGELPAVEERIPDKENVYVETTLRNGGELEIGTYGGILRQAKNGKFGDWDCCRFTSLERPMDFYSDGSSFLNVLKGVESNEDSTVWTMHLREGMKWSDGEDFNADDITFWYYMTHINDYDRIAYWTALFTMNEDGTRNYAKMEKIDDYTLTLTYAEPKNMADLFETGDLKFMWCPQHFWADKVPSSYYVENPYWPDAGLSDEQVLANFLAVGMEFATVRDAGNCVYKPWRWYQIPTIHAWMVSSEEGFNNNECDIMKFVRNPYYWKVDAAGQQLPYLDEIWAVRVNAADQAILKLESGDVDFTLVDIKDVAAVQEAMGDGVELKTLAATTWGAHQIGFNLTHPDEKINALLNNISFRIALNKSVDREQVCQLWYNGLTEPHGFSPQYPNIGYSEEWENLDYEYNPEECIRLLTEDCGLVMGDDGFFNYADGSDVELRLLSEVTKAEEAEQIAVLQKYWEAIGLKINLVQDENAGNTFDSPDGGWELCDDQESVNGYRFESRPKQFIPLQAATTWYAMYDIYGKASGEKYTDAYENEELGKICDLYKQWSTIPELKDRLDIELEIFDIIIRNHFAITYSTAPGKYYMVRTGYGNWADTMLNEDKFNYFMMWNWWTIYDKSAAN